VGGNPNFVIVNPSGTQFAVSYNVDRDYVDLYSTIDYSLTKSIPIADVNSITFDDTGSFLYVLQNASGVDSIKKYSMSTYSEVDSIQLSGSWLSRILYYKENVYTVSKANNTVLKFDDELTTYTESVPNAIKQDGYTYDLLVDKTNNLIIASSNNGTLAGFNVNTLAFTTLYNTGVSTYIFGASVNSSGYVFANLYTATTKIAVLYPNGTLLTSYTLPSNAGLVGIVINPYNRTIFAAGWTNNILYVVNSDTGSIIASGLMGNAPYHITIGTQAYPIQHSVKFVVQSLFGLLKYSNVTVSLYDENGIHQYTKSTDESGQVAFYLSLSTKYTVTAISTADNINETITIVPYDDTYYFNVWSFFVDWNPFGWMQGVTDWTGPGTGDVNRDIKINYTADTSVSPRIISINYSDATASTTALNFTLLRHWQENGTYTVYNTTLVSGSGISYQQMLISVTADDADGNSYQIVVTATTDAYGTVKRMDTYHFPGVSYPLPGLPTDWYPYVAIGIIIMFGLFFTYLSTGLGLIVMAFWGIVFMFMGWLVWSDAFLLLMQILAVFGVGHIFKMKRQREGI
jgi:hypothetical protein